MWTANFNTSVVIGAGYGIVMNKDANQLTDVHGETKLDFEKLFHNYCNVTDCTYKGVGVVGAGRKPEVGYTFQLNCLE